MKKYSRTEIKFYNKDSFCVTKETLNKWVCQVFISPENPEYEKVISGELDDFVCLLKGDSWEEVNNMFKEMNDKER